MSKSILINAISARNGGGITYIKNILPFFAKYRCENKITVLVSRDNIELEELSNIQGINLIKIDTSSENLLVRGYFEIFKLPRIMKRGKYDILFSPGGTSLTLKSKHFQTITMFRNVWPHFHSNTFKKSLKNIFNEPISFFKLKLLKYIIILNCRYQDKTIYISNHGKKLIYKDKKPKNIAIVIKHSINETFFDYKELASEFTFSPKNYILYTSSFLPYKNHEKLLKAFSKIKDVFDECPLILIGKISPKYKKYIEKYIEDIGLQGRVIILEEVGYDALASLYQNSLFNLFLSSCENCPNIMQEAMASKRPLLSSTFDPMPEFGKDLVTYCNPENERDIIEALIAMKENISDLEFDAIKLFKDISNIRGWEQTSQKTLNFLLQQET